MRGAPLVVLMIFLLTAVAAFGQTSRGIVTGIVTDPQAAVVPNATVELTGVNTGVKYTTVANNSGLYRFAAVDPGSYSLTIKASGFKTYVTQCAVEGGQVLSLDARLQVGEMTTVVEIQADATPLQYESAIRGSNISATTIVELPQDTRDPAQFALTLPGVSTNRFGFATNSFVVNGSRGRSNNFMLDGSENNDVSLAGQALTVNNPDAVAEISVQTSNYDAEFGRAGGAVINTITKQGTNRFHGTLMYLLDSTYDDAITNTQMWSDEISKIRKHPPAGTEQWYGFTVGGPIVKNKTFFFFSFQDQRRASQNTNNLVTPTAAGWTTLASLSPKGTNPRVDLYTQVAGGVVATSQPFSVPMGNNRPAVEFGTKIQPYTYKYLDRQYMIRIDHQFGSADQLSGRWLADNQTSPQGGASPFFPGFSTSSQYPSKAFLLTWTHIFSPRWTNEFRLPYTRANLNLPVDTENPLGKTMPLYTIGGGITPIGVQTNLPQGKTSNNYSLQDTVSNIRGKHSFRAGLNINMQRTRQFAPIRERGEIAYGTTTGFSNFANFVDDFGGGNGTVYRDFGSARYYPSFTRQAYFFQDRWRATQNLTITMGVRYEYFGTPMNSLKKASYSGLFNVDPVTGIGPYLNPTKVDPDKNNFSPTVGIAYSPSYSSGLLGKILGEKRTVIRTGYAIGYDSFFNNIASNAAVATPNVIATTQPSIPSSANLRGIANWSTLVPAVARSPLPIDSQTLMSPHLVNPYYQRWSFGIQREISGSFVLDIAYVGTKGTKLFANEDLNPFVPATMRVTPSTTPTLFALQLRLDPLQGGRLTRTNGGDSNYHALQISADRRMAKGLQLKVSYTWSRTIDNASEVFGVTNSNSPQNTAIPSIYGGLQIDRGLSFSDRPHRAVISYLYELPLMKDQKGVLGRVLGGWQLSGITTFESGVPLNVSNGLDADGIGGNWDRPNYNPNGTPGVRAQYSTTSATGYINPDANNAPINPATAMYIQLPANTGNTSKPTGNLGRNTLRMPGLNNWNANFFKNFRITERIGFQVRSEFYNIWNHPQYGQQSVSPFSPLGGSMQANVGTSPAGRFLNKFYLDGGGRVIRYQIRLSF
jgi:outer membrane receptor protein involved in Fe transport